MENPTARVRKRSCQLGIRTSEETKEKLDLLVELLGKALGTEVTKGQALEVAIGEAVAKRVGV